MLVTDAPAKQWFNEGAPILPQEISLDTRGRVRTVRVRGICVYACQSSLCVSLSCGKASFFNVDGGFGGFGGFCTLLLVRLLHILREHHCDRWRGGLLHSRRLFERPKDEHIHRLRCAGLLLPHNAVVDGGQHCLRNLCAYLQYSRDDRLRATLAKRYFPPLLHQCWPFSPPNLLRFCRSSTVLL